MKIITTILLSLLSLSAIGQNTADETRDLSGLVHALHQTPAIQLTASGLSSVTGVNSLRIIQTLFAAGITPINGQYFTERIQNEFPSASGAVSKETITEIVEERLKEYEEDILELVMAVPAPEIGISDDQVTEDGWTITFDSGHDVTLTIDKLSKLLSLIDPPFGQSSRDLSMVEAQIAALDEYFEAGYSDRKIASKGTIEDWKNIGESLGYKFERTREMHRIAELRSIMTN